MLVTKAYILVPILLYFYIQNVIAWVLKQKKLSEITIMRKINPSN